ncbi:type II secretion system major pseudopilin GspG [Kordiimonas marina]|uniref:type II secretion system major pseudopilin GspG n=1 Tax=Kordiimonas marina TaxID=2872312 RepID=UPI001FF43529|nr:type II secretion system major pseudopilin GspG [Kordiimonas marina]MCJ9430040.1 type II secretion system major pseudopilin GspG [Kordiimonas marina]
MISLLSKQRLKALAQEEDGYTLLELLVVLVIITLIIGIAGPMVLRQFGKAKSDTARAEVSRLATDLEFFRVDVGRFPTQQEGLNSLLVQPDGVTTWQGPYLPKASQLNDPWGRPYLYTLSADGQTVTVSSLGADGAVGGSGENQDVSNQD